MTFIRKINYIKKQNIPKVEVIPSGTIDTEKCVTFTSSSQMITPLSRGVTLQHFDALKVTKHESLLAGTLHHSTVMVASGIIRSIAQGADNWTCHFCNAHRRLICLISFILFSNVFCILNNT